MHATLHTHSAPWNMYLPNSTHTYNSPGVHRRPHTRTHTLMRICTYKHRHAHRHACTGSPAISAHPRPRSLWRRSPGTVRSRARQGPRGHLAWSTASGARRGRSRRAWGVRSCAPWGPAGQSGTCGSGVRPVPRERSRTRDSGDPSPAPPLNWPRPRRPAMAPPRPTLPPDWSCPGLAPPHFRPLPSFCLLITPPDWPFP